MDHTLENTDLGVNGEIGYWRAGKTGEEQGIKPIVCREGQFEYQFIKNGNSNLEVTDKGKLKQGLCLTFTIKKQSGGNFI